MPGYKIPNTFKIIDAVAITAGTPVVIWTPASGKIVRLLGYILSLSAVAALEFQDSGAGGTIIFKSGLLVTGLLIPISQPDLGEGVVLALADNTLNLDVTANATISGTVWGTEE